MSIIGIEAVTFGVKNIAKSKKFLTDWGLKVQKTGAYGTDYACVDGSEVKIRAFNSRWQTSAIKCPNFNIGTVNACVVSAIRSRSLYF